jgi:hypothetical protein
MQAGGALALSLIFEANFSGAEAKLRALKCEASAVISETKASDQSYCSYKSLF